MYLCEPRHWEIDGDPLAWLWSQTKHHIENLILKSEKLERKKFDSQKSHNFWTLFLDARLRFDIFGKKWNVEEFADSENVNQANK